MMTWLPEVDMPDALDFVELERVAIAVAESAGRLIVDDRPARLGVAHTKSSATDVVTVMDQRSQDHLLARLAQLRPDDAVFGEEEGGRVGTSGITWVIDPIDGTVNYLYEIAAYAVSVAAVVGDPRVAGQWRPVAGAIVDPVAGLTFHAALGRGAGRRDARGREVELAGPAAGAELGAALVATGFGYATTRRRWQAAVLAEVLPRVRDIRRMGSAALDLCRVASGEVDAYYETGLQPWDLAAGWLVATEAGVTCGGLDAPSRPGVPSEDLVWAAGRGLADEFGSLVTQLTRTHRDD